MHKTITYSTFIVSSIVVVLLFVTAKSYTQLIVAILLYPGVAYVALNIFTRNDKKEVLPAPVSPGNTHQDEIVQTNEVAEKGQVDIADVDKRAFLKLIGAAGLSFFIFSLFNRRSELPFLSKGLGSGTTTLKDTDGTSVDPAQKQPLDGYHISEIDDSEESYYGFTNKEGAWIIMREDAETNSFRYAKGDSDFSTSWAKHKELKYDYFYNVF